MIDRLKTLQKLCFIPPFLNWQHKRRKIRYVDHQRALKLIRCNLISRLFASEGLPVWTEKWIYLVSLSLGQSTVRLYGQTHQILSQSLLHPAQRHQRLRLPNMALQVGRRETRHSPNFHMGASHTHSFIVRKKRQTLDQWGMSLQATSASIRAFS